ncbi:LuxR C-terminal-related transcriptional regulator [Bradyrhizobium sp. BR13661]|uniref:helix-turn-helix transcriptional regulator n=1 Tax=Bradyrhizobium sp. BR13661 TaxID=2940622 RepID=UPI0024745869|nr:LuxR C-terminal-related transcriptional regulator [Bradyrhizobium sp. BR13661]MDH6258472.1 DNA-binding CsgD family transcriptional regulator/PAS domain-containing protein [Bradyrhizobium sp. BR13661]
MREVARLVNELMDTDNKLLSIVTSIYDAALDDSRWNEVLDRVVTFTGGRAGGLVSFRPTGEIEFAQGIGFAAPFVQSYIENYGSIDPARTVRYAEIGQVLTAEDWAPIDHFRSSRFYREWARPQGLEDGVNVLLTRSATSISHISVSKAGSLVDGAMRDAMSRLVPHLRRAIAINQKLRHEGAVAASSIQAIEALRTALFLLDPRGHILHANASGRDILDQNNVLRSMQGRVVTVDPRVNRTFQQALAASAPGGRTTPGESTAVVLRAADGTHYVGHFLPLTAGLRMVIGNAFEASVALFVSRASLDPIPGTELIQRIFKLTPTELRVLLAIVDIGGVPDVARSLDVAETTVKTHLSKIFAKTDTKRQPDLVRLVAAFSPPIKA